MAPVTSNNPEPDDDGSERFELSPALKAAFEQLAEQQRRILDAVQSPGFRALTDQLAEQQRRLNDAFQSPGFKALTDHFAEQQRRLNDAFQSPGFKALTGHFTEQQRRLHDAVQSPGFKALTDHFAEQQRRLNDAVNSSGFKTVMEQLGEQQRRVWGALGSEAFREVLDRAAEAFRKWDEGERRLLDMLAPSGWIISPSSSIADLSNLVTLADEEGVEAVEAALLAELTSARCREIVEGLYERPSFAKWRVPLDQALAAHEQGLYALAVPVWLIALDGIFLAELGIDRVFSRVHSKGGRAVRKHFDKGPGGRWLDALIRAIRVVAEHMPAERPSTSGELRRNAVLHGLDPNYGTEKASVQGVLLLEVLHFQLEAAIDPGSEGS